MPRSSDGYGKTDDSRPVDPEKWDKSWARRCKNGCKGPYANGICIYCGEIKK